MTAVFCWPQGVSNITVACNILTSDKRFAALPGPPCILLSVTSICIRSPICVCKNAYNLCTTSLRLSHVLNTQPYGKEVLWGERDLRYEYFGSNLTLNTDCGGFLIMT
jgi:hypothetical protein